MEFLSAVMLVIIALLLCLSIPRIYACWLSCRSSVASADAGQLQELLSSERFWVHRHLVCAAMGIGMAVMAERTSLSAVAPNLSQVTAVYAAISLTLGLVEALFAQKISDVLAVQKKRASSR